MVYAEMWTSGEGLRGLLEVAGMAVIAEAADGLDAIRPVQAAAAHQFILRSHNDPGWRPDHPFTCSGTRCTLRLPSYNQV
jgi:hypothetical protein